MAYLSILIIHFQRPVFISLGNLLSSLGNGTKNLSLPIALYALKVRCNNASLWNCPRVLSQSHEPWRWRKFHILSWAVVMVAFQQNSQMRFEPWQEFHHFLESKKKKCEFSKSCKYFNYKNVFLFWDNIFSFKKLWWYT